MIKEIIKYETSDGSQFPNKQDAMTHERLIHTLALAISNINVCSDGNDSHGIANDKDKILNFNICFGSILRDYSSENHSRWLSNKRGILGRYLSDDFSPQGQALYGCYIEGILCVGEQNNRSYGQPFYAKNK